MGRQGVPDGRCVVVACLADSSLLSANRSPHAPVSLLHPSASSVPLSTPGPTNPTYPPPSTDYSISCSSDHYENSLLPWALLLTVCIPIGMPVIALSLLAYNREALRRGGGRIDLTQQQWESRRASAAQRRSSQGSFAANLVSSSEWKQHARARP